MKRVTKIICDRCGKEIITTPDNPFPWTIKLMIDSTSGCERHLCNECNFDLGRWFTQKHKPNCSSAEHNPSTGKCYGYGRSENDDEPIDACQSCELYESYGIE